MGDKYFKNCFSSFNMFRCILGLKNEMNNLKIGHLNFSKCLFLSFLFELNQYEIIPMIADIWYSKANSRFPIFSLE